MDNEMKKLEEEVKAQCDEARALFKRLHIKADLRIKRIKAEKKKNKKIPNVIIDKIATNSITVYDILNIIYDDALNDAAKVAACKKVLSPIAKRTRRLKDGTLKVMRY